jgi:outer membrane protein assembly factor BamB
MAGFAVIAPAAGPSVPLPLFPLTRVWEIALDHALAVPPAFDDQFGYFALDDGTLQARLLTTGSMAWSIRLELSTLPAAGDRLLFAATATGVSAFRASDGSPVWSIPISGVAEPLVWKAGWLLAASESGVLVALRANDGHEIWRRDLGARPHARVTIVADRVYVPMADGRIVALAIENGMTLWEYRLGGAASEVAAAGTRVYAGSVDNYFYCLDASDGRELWRWRTGADVIGMPVVDDNHVYFVSLDNILRALDRSHGAQRWMRALPLRPNTGPVLIGQTIIVSGLSPSLRGFAATTGAPLGDFALAGDVAAPPHAVADSRSPFPLVVVVSGNAAGSAVISALTRNVEPAIVPVAPLPGLVTVGAADATGPAAGPGF